MGTHRDRRAELGRALLTEWRRRPEEALEVARSLAPPGSGPGVRFHVYEGDDSGDSLPNLRSPAKIVRFQEAFPEPQPWFEALAAGNPGALEIGAAVVSRLAAERFLPLAPALLALPPWSGLWSQLGRALARSRSAEAFALLMAHARDHTAMGLALGESLHPGGVVAARVRFDAIPDVLSADIDPRERIVAAGLVRYLVCHGGRAELDLAVVVFRGAASELVYAAGHALWHRGEAGVSTLSPRRSTMGSGRDGGSRPARSCGAMLRTPSMRSVGWTR